MTDFILPGSIFGRIPTILRKVQGFTESPEHQELRDYETEIAGVVCGAFARFLVRIHAEENRSPDPKWIDVQIESALEALEVLASAKETAVRTLIADEIFETLLDTSVALPALESRFHTNTKSFYMSWSERERHSR